MTHHLLSRSALPIWRRALATFALVPAVGAWNQRGAGVALGIGLVLPTLTMHLRATWAQLAMRAALWTALVIVASPGAKPIGVVGGAIALLALSTKGLEGEDNFRPRAFRAELQALLVVGGVATLSLVAEASTGSMRWARLHPARVAFQVGWIIVAMIGLVGTYRLRVWGVLCLLGAIAACASFALLGDQRVAGYVLWSELSPRVWLSLFAVAAGITGMLARSLRDSRSTTRLSAFDARDHAVLVVVVAAFAVFQHA